MSEAVSSRQLFEDFTVLAWKECRACASEFTVHTQDIYLQRQKKTVPQYHCLDCGSFFHTSSYVEDDKTHRGDADWLSEHPADTAVAKQIVNQLKPKRVYEAGCGVGTLLQAFQQEGVSVAGVDPNPFAVKKAVEKGIPAEVGYFTALAEQVDAILAIDVLEHVQEPRRFFSDLRKSVVDGGHIIVRVPEITQELWPHLKGSDRPRQPCQSDPFDDASVHITNFSTEGLIRMSQAIGTTYVGRFANNCHVFRATSLR